MGNNFDLPPMPKFDPLPKLNLPKIEQFDFRKMDADMARMNRDIERSNREIERTNRQMLESRIKTDDRLFADIDRLSKETEKMLQEDARMTRQTNAVLANCDQKTREFEQWNKSFRRSFQAEFGYDPNDAVASRQYIDNIVKRAKDDKKRIERYGKWATACGTAGPNHDGWIPMQGREGFEVKRCIHVKDGGWHLLYRTAGQRREDPHLTEEYDRYGNLMKRYSDKPATHVNPLKLRKAENGRTGFIDTLFDFTRKVLKNGV
jgi:hypothetical protein